MGAAASKNGGGPSNGGTSASGIGGIITSNSENGASGMPLSCASASSCTGAPASATASTVSPLGVAVAAGTGV